LRLEKLSHPPEWISLGLWDAQHCMDRKPRLSSTADLRAFSLFAQGCDLFGGLFCQAVLGMVLHNELIELFGVVCRFPAAFSGEI
jgi:hypothetical protein